MYYYIHYRDYVFSSIPQMLQTRLNLKQRYYNFRQIKKSLSIFFRSFLVVARTARETRSGIDFHSVLLYCCCGWKRCKCRREETDGLTGDGDEV
jgi:hypothetical protein